MSFQELWKEENEAIRERYELSLNRIREMQTEETVKEPYRSYFLCMADFVAMTAELWEAVEGRGHEAWTLEEKERWNHRLYADILPDHYDESYGSPVYACACLGETYGRLLSFFYTEMRGMIVFVYERRLAEITILMETLIEIYNLFETGEGPLPDGRAVKDVLYWYVSDYCDQTQVYRIREGLDPNLDFARDIILHADLKDPGYLYLFGEYITESERQVSRFMNSLPEETVTKMADAFTEGYCRGFSVMRRDLSRKKTVAIRYELGFERMIRKAVRNFQDMGLEAVFCRAPVQALFQRPGTKAGYHGASPNRQWEYDHRYDKALFWDKRLKERQLSVLRVAYGQYRELAAAYAGPAVVESFGGEAFEPVNHEQASRLSEKQEKLLLEYASESARIANEYIPGDETSFTIIAWPLPGIGADFEAIFEEMIRINTLDYEIYKEIQQKLIDALDQGIAVEITGKGENQTGMRVGLRPLEDPRRETLFENCLADVNIPLGEVFTSPMLSGTSGLLHVSRVCIGEYRFQDLKLWFEDGKITDYSCGNFPSAEEGRQLIRQVILKNHETLPLGEFAIGTNTAAYAMAERFGIFDKLPILIAEKMGPHFAVGDTCYSWSEDSSVYNPDGKEIVARDNEISLLRKEDVSKAYFNCHTDITIPYRELGGIRVVTKDGDRISLIENGRFALPGTELLNQAL